MTTLAEMIACGLYGYINPNFTENNFPVVPERFTLKGLQVCCYGKTMKTQEILADFERCGLKAATIEQLLAYGAKNPEEQRQYPIIGLGSFWTLFDGDRRFPCLGTGYYRSRGLYAGWENAWNPWGGHCRFLAFRE